MAQTNASKLLSIQGEQTDAAGGWFQMDQDDVDSYVDRSPDGVLICRERGRHWWPTISEAGIAFSDIDESTGLFIRRLECKSCRLAVRKEWSEAVRRGKNALLPGEQRHRLPRGTRRGALPEPERPRPHGSPGRFVSPWRPRHWSPEPGGDALGNPEA